ncbi:hypothetical protein I552_4243 [Mycobacterium xenopi 3993]|nr:hypothetical protein I552_4243 [Mycobacterium xenopi 3993]
MIIEAAPPAPQPQERPQPAIVPWVVSAKTASGLPKQAAG